MNNSDTEFLDRTATENSESQVWELVIPEKDYSNGSNFILTTKPLEAVVKFVKPDSESEDDGNDVPLSNMVAKKKMLFGNGINVLKSQHWRNVALLKRV